MVDELDGESQGVVSPVVTMRAITQLVVALDFSKMARVSRGALVLAPLTTMRAVGLFISARKEIGYVVCAGAVSSYDVQSL
jgi:hypothetical protein